MFPYLYDFSLGSFRVAMPTYSLFALCGLILSGVVFLALVENARNKPVAYLLFFGTLAFSGGMAGRVTQIAVDLYRTRTLDIPLATLVSASGSSVIGGIVAAGIVLYVYVRFDPHRIMTWHTLDALAVAFPFGHMMGRFGCMAAGCCYGVLCSTPSFLTVTYPDNWIVAELSRHPIAHGPRIAAPLISAAGLFVIGMTLLVVFRSTRNRGQVAALYLLLYGPLRFLHDHIRGDLAAKGIWGPLSTGQWFALVALGAGCGLLLSFHARKKRGRAGPPFLPLNGKGPRLHDAFARPTAESGFWDG